MEIKISIIIPVYNVEKYIQECLDSVCRQTLKELEILCINDASTDSSVEIIQQIAMNDSRFRLIQNEKNIGAGETRNRGIMLAKGKYFFFLDADDFLETDAMEKLYQCAERRALELCFCANVFYNEKDKSITKIPRTTDIFLKKYQDQVFSWSDVQRFLYQNIFCVPWNRLYLTDFVRNSTIRFPNLRNSEDFFFGEAIVTVAERMGVADAEHPLIYYRLGREGQVSLTVGQNPYCMLESVKLLYDFLIKHHKLHGMEKSYHSIVLEVLFYTRSLAEDAGQVIDYTVNKMFPEIGMSKLINTDFANLASYKHYCELLNGRESDFDSYMISVMEDENKLDKIKMFMEQHIKDKIALWGMGKRGQVLIDRLGRTDCKFDYFIDKNLRSNEKTKKSEIYRLDEIKDSLEYIMLTNTNYFEEIYAQCKKKNPNCKVIDLDTFFRCDMTIEECMA